MKTLGLDESGDDNLEKVDPAYPIFVVGGVILENDYIPTATEAVSKFKRELFGRDDFVLHTAEIMRSRGAFSRLRQPGFRQEFYDQLNDLVHSLEFSVIACAVRKDRYAPGSQAIDRDLYRLALRSLTNQFCEIVGDHRNGGRIRAERRRPDMDQAVDRSWEELCLDGTAATSAATIRRRIASLTLHTKHDRLVVLELADLVVTPIGRHISGHPDQADWHIVQEKLHGDADSAVTIFPEQG